MERPAISEATLLYPGADWGGDADQAAEINRFLSIFLAGLRPRPLGRKERPATSEATLLYRARIGEGMQTPSQSLASSQRDVSLLLNN
jgi:hypothetical protein